MRTRVSRRPCMSMGGTLSTVRRFKRRSWPGIVSRPQCRKTATVRVAGGRVYGPGEIDRLHHRSKPPGWSPLAMIGERFSVLCNEKVQVHAGSEILSRDRRELGGGVDSSPWLENRSDPRRRMDRIRLLTHGDFVTCAVSTCSS